MHQGVFIKTLMHEYGIFKTSVYRYLKEAVGSSNSTKDLFNTWYPASLIWR